jgi:hypothetical protein
LSGYYGFVHDGREVRYPCTVGYPGGPAYPRIAENPRLARHYRLARDQAILRDAALVQDTCVIGNPGSSFVRQIVFGFNVTPEVAAPYIAEVSQGSYAV